MAKKKIYAIVDLETTGGMARRDRITELAIVVYDGEEIIDQYDTLVNPERSIPTEITRITGITNDMVSRAPKFYEVAKKVVEMTEGAIFVAHNVRFDYSFLKEEFARLGFTFTRKQLCTVRMSRMAFPGLKSYSLGNLIEHFDISVNARHRALDDTLATTIVLGHILNSHESEAMIATFINKGIIEAQLPENVNKERLLELPEAPGVYYFYNGYGKIIYVGKSKNIQKRVIQHFSKTTNKSLKLAKMMHDLHHEETGDELLALLLESSEIKKHQPEINKAQRTAKYPYFIHTYLDLEGYICFEILKSSTKNRANKQILEFFGSIDMAKSQLDKMRTLYELCDKRIGVYKDEGPCFNYKINQCKGACIKEESADDYNERARMAFEAFNHFFDTNFFIKLTGRTGDETGIALVEDGQYRGFGYIDNNSGHYNSEDLKSVIKEVVPNPELNSIVRNYIRKNTKYNVVYF